MRITKYIPFILILIPTILFCLAALSYCQVNGQAIASRHTEPQYFWRFSQCLAAGLLTVFLAFRRVKYYWYSIPFMLILTANLYIPIIAQYPCCIGG